MKKLVILFTFIVFNSHGQAKCYLDYHMKKGFVAREFCWGSNTKKFIDTLSFEARNYLDSVFNKIGADPRTVVCQKIKLKDVSKYIENEKVNSSHYFYSMFERTYDCFDNYTYKNYKGKVRVKKDTKVILEYLLGIEGNFEMLRIYIINDKPLISLL